MLRAVSSDAARAAAAAAAVELVEPGMTIGLGSGRAVWKVIELLGGLPPEARPRAAFASERTRELARAAGIEEQPIDGETRLALAIDGADEVGPRLGLIKGGGAALLREKIVVEAAERFVVVAETAKQVERLGERCRLPVEIVRFGWRDTRRRVLGLVPAGDLRETERGDPVVTDEGHYLVDCEIPADRDPEELAAAIKETVGVVEHGLFLGLASLALLGTPDGGVERVEP
jgi:ribose 5-phosphate isomerase A